MFQKKNCLSGLIVPVFVPYRDDGKINYCEYQKFIRFLHDKGASGIFVCGTSGEFIHQSLTERLNLLTAARDAAPKNLTLMYNISSLILDEVETYINHGTKIGVDALSIIPPWYFKYSADELITYFGIVSRMCAQYPLYFYNFPERTGNPITPSILRQILPHCPNLCGGKDSSKDFDQMMNYRAVAGTNFELITGDDMQVFATAVQGNKAAICGMGNIVPELISAIYTLIDNGDIEAALSMQIRVNEIKRVISRTGSLMGYKRAAEHRGFAMGPIRPPFSDIDPTINKGIKDYLATLDYQQLSGKGMFQ